MKNNYYQSPKASRLMRLFWKACGGDRYILERSTYSDQVKYFCLGGIVIATGVLAGLSGGYAIYTIFEPKGVNAMAEGTDLKTLIFALIFGAIWGLVIFNIDRFIVTSTGKGDGTEKITKNEFYGAIPRIIMGIIIALTISKPIEIRMFQSEINQALFQKQEILIDKAQEDANNFFADKFQDHKNEKKQLINEINVNRQEYTRLENEATAEAEGSGGTGSRGLGEHYIRKEGLAESAKINWKVVEKINKKKISLLDEKIDKLEIKKNEKIANANIEAKQLDGLLERLKLAHKVAGWEISLFITLLFMVIELTPIFFKMMLIKGPYDYMDENIRELAKAEAGIEIHYNFFKSKDELRDNLKEESNINKTSHGYEVHQVINHAAELKRKERIAMINAQEELNEVIIQEWKTKKKDEIKNNPDKYIQED